MKFGNNENEELQKEVLELLESSENKSEAIFQAIQKVNEAEHANLIAEIALEAANAESDKEYANKLGLRTLNKEEKEFYEKLKDVKQAINADQIDIIPTSIINRTLDDVKKESGILGLIDFTPADVKKWLVAEKSGAYSWTSLTGAISEQLGATISALNIELNKLYVALIIPKAINELALPFVDKYFTAILRESMIDGLEYGFLVGTGKDMPIGIYKQIGTVNQDGTHADKTLNEVINFTPKGLAPVKKYLSKNGKRTFDKIVLICNPADEADYVAPAIYDDEGRIISSYKNIEVMQSANNPQGKAIFTLPKKYVMGMSGFKINEYKETKAMDDADLTIAKAYANGRAVDDYCAYPIDVTKLEEFVRSVKVVNTVSVNNITPEETTEENGTEETPQGT